MKKKRVMALLLAATLTIGNMSSLGMTQAAGKEDSQTQEFVRTRAADKILH